MPASIAENEKGLAGATGFNSVNDWFISKLFQRKGETLEQTKARLEAGRTRGSDAAMVAQQRSREISQAARNGQKK